MEWRVEKDSLGDVRVPADALYGAQTQRAVENFPISGIPFPRVFIRALGLIKHAAADANEKLGYLEPKTAYAIRQAAQEVIDGKLDAHFPLDIYQTGSGTSTNMNANEVISNRAIQVTGGVIGSKTPVHPNDHVNMSQSSNDVIPTAIHVAAYIAVVEELRPALAHLRDTLLRRQAEFEDVVKTGRTHLMDAMPIRFGQQLSGYVTQVSKAIERVDATLPRLAELAIGGTAVGTGINADAAFSGIVAKRLEELTGIPFREADNHFEAQAAQDAAVELSGQLKTVGASLMKISNDFRWMNSGPQTGLGEVVLPATQPGSSIMPGKINPVICEAMTLVCAQVIGNDVAVTIGGQSGNFELNLMLPLIAHNLLQSIKLLANASRVLADKAISGFTINRGHMEDLVEKNPILVTALAPHIGYDLSAQIAKRAMKEGRKVRDVAREMTSLTEDELDRYLNTRGMTEGGYTGASAGG
jgi:fumarate hydratase class II